MRKKLKGRGHRGIKEKGLNEKRGTLVTGFPYILCPK